MHDALTQRHRSADPVTGVVEDGNTVTGCHDQGALQIAFQIVDVAAGLVAAGNQFGQFGDMLRGVSAGAWLRGGSTLAHHGECVANLGAVAAL